VKIDSGLRRNDGMDLHFGLSDISRGID